MYKIKRQVSHDIIIPCVDDRNSFTRFFHSRPDMPPIDIYVDGIMRVQSIPYLGLSFYVSSVASTHNVQYYESGTKNLLLDIPEVVKYAIPSDYIKVKAGSYTLHAKTNNLGAYNPTARISLPIGKLTSIYMVGSLDPASKLFKEGGSAQFVIMVDGNTMFSKCW